MSIPQEWNYGIIANIAEHALERALFGWSDYTTPSKEYVAAVVGGELKFSINALVTEAKAVFRTKFAVQRPADKQGRSDVMVVAHQGELYDDDHQLVSGCENLPGIFGVFNRNVQQAWVAAYGEQEEEA